MSWFKDTSLNLHVLYYLPTELLALVGEHGICCCHHSTVRYPSRTC